MRRFARARGLLADAVFAVDDGRSARREAQGEADVLGDGGEGLRARRQFPARLPVAVPYARLVAACAGDAGTGAIEALVVAEALAVDIGEGEVRQVEIVDAPGGGIGFVSLRSPWRKKTSSKP